MPFIQRFPKVIRDPGGHLPAGFAVWKTKYAILHLSQIFRKIFMKNTKKVLDIHGLVYYYIKARVRGDLCARTAMMQEIAP